MIIKYRTFLGHIERVELAGETPHQVIKANGRREAKNCDSWQYHDTFDAAKEHLVQECTRGIADHKARLSSARANLDRVLMLRNRWESEDAPE